MNDIDLRRFDLNLLEIFSLLLQERQVSRAADRAGLSQSAVSHALSRLRRAFDDPLFVRSANGMEPTARAAALEDQVQRVLDEIGAMLGGEAFHPAEAGGTIRVVAADYAMAMVMPQALARLEREAPGLDIECHDWSGRTMDQLEKGLVDLVLGGQERFAGVESEELFRERFVTACRAGHPYLASGRTVEDYIAWPHAMIDVPNSRMVAIDAELRRLGTPRRIRLRLPHFLAAPMILARSDMLLTFPERMALFFSDITDWQLSELPIPLGAFSYRQFWHRRRDQDPLHRWVRRVLREEAALL